MSLRERRARRLDRGLSAGQLQLRGAGRAIRPRRLPRVLRAGRAGPRSLPARLIELVLRGAHLLLRLLEATRLELDLLEPPLGLVGGPPAFALAFRELDAVAPQG
jgi:hypothetical protein